MASFQKKLAAKILKVGVSRIWIDPSKIEDVKKAVTKADIRKLIKKGVIKALPPKKNKKTEKKKRKGPGSRKGKLHSRSPKKREWINTVRPLRKYLKELKKNGMIDQKTYKHLYRLVKGGMFRSRAHLKIYLEQHGLLREKK